MANSSYRGESARGRGAGGSEREEGVIDGEGGGEGGFDHKIS